jgi:hypothetical protein
MTARAEVVLLVLLIPDQCIRALRQQFSQLSKSFCVTQFLRHVPNNVHLLSRHALFSCAHLPIPFRGASILPHV